MSSISLKSLTLVFAMALALLFSASAGMTAEAPAGSAPKSDEFLKHWLVLKPILVSSQKQNAPDEEAQKQSFAQDWLR